MTRKAATRATPEKEVNERAMLIFCAALAEAATVTEACAQAGIHKVTAYRWRNNDEEFAQAWDDALDAGTDILEAEATRRAVHGVEEPVVYQGQLTPIYERDEFGGIRMVEVEVPDGQGGTRRITQPVQAVDAQGNPKWLTIRKPSDTLMIFMLKARRPEKYRERIAAELTGKDGKDLPAVPAGVLVVPGLATDPAAWSGAVQQAALPAGEG